MLEIHIIGQEVLFSKFPSPIFLMVKQSLRFIIESTCNQSASPITKLKLDTYLKSVAGCFH